MELNALDRKILYLLDSEDRAGVKAIARKIRRSAEVVRYRIRRLEAEGVIRRYMSFINFSRLGFVGHGVFCTIKERQERKKWIGQLEQNERVYWISEFGGKYDLAFAIAARDTYEFYRILNQLKEKLGGSLGGWDIAIRIRLNQFPRSYLLDKDEKRRENLPYFGKTLGHDKLDGLDFRILKKLSQEARLDANSIAEYAQAPASTVAYRIKKLRESGVLQGAAPQICCQNYGYQSYQLFINVANLDEKKRQELYSYCSNNPNIVFLIETLGKWNFEIVYDVKNQRELQDQVLRLRQSIRWEFEMETGIIFDNYLKYDQFPFKSL